MASKEWIIYGKDGYDALIGTKMLTDESVAEELHVILKRFFGILFIRENYSFFHCRNWT